MDRPLFIVFEGIDGCGKSTQAKRLAEYFSSVSIPVALTAEPSDSPAGIIIKSLKTRPEPEQEYELFVEDRRHHVRNVILPSLEKGFTVICDRYVYSSAAYQGSRGLDVEKILLSNFEFAPKPDIVFIIEIPVDLAIERIRKNRDAAFSLFEKRDSLQRVDRVYKDLHEKEIIRLNGAESEDMVSQEIISVIQSCMDTDWRKSHCPDK